MKNIIYVSAFLLITGLLSAEHYQNSPQPGLHKNPVNQDTLKDSIKVASDPKLGKFLTDGRGMTLYMFTDDKNRTSTCYDQCAVAWPPFVVYSEKVALPTGVVGKSETVKRRDNTFQVTYNGMPLYFYVKDKKPGDVFGQNVDGKWFVVQPK